MTNTTEVRNHFRTCNLCEAMCGLKIQVRGQEILSIQGDRDDPFSRGHICPKPIALQDVYNDPDRLRQPVRRTATGWETIGWEEALDEVADRLKAVQQSHGRHAVAVYQGNPNVHNFGSILFSPPFVRSLHTKHRFSATSVDQLPHHFAARMMFGHQLLLPVPDIDRTDILLMLGANPAVSNGSLMTAPDVVRRLKAIQTRGGAVIVVDPRKTETAQLADEHLFIRPGADVFLLLALLHTIFEEELARPGRLADFTDGLDMLRTAVADFPPEAVASQTGIGPDRIRSLARTFAAAERAVAYGRIGLSTQAFGGLCQWLINALNIVTGNLDRPGGAMFTLPAVDVVGITAQMGATGRFGRWTSRVRKLPEFGGELPVATLAEEILTPGEDQIRALVTSAGNPVLSTPNGRQLEKALSSLEFMVSIDIYINETTRFANIILPPATGLESDNYDIVFHSLAVRNTAKYSPALFEPSPGARYDWEIFRDLRIRMEGKQGKGDMFHRFSPAQIVDLALRYGPYGYWGKNRDDRRLTLSKLRAAPHGIDLGPLQPCLPDRLCTGDKRIALAPPACLQDLERARALLAQSPGRADELALIGRRQLRSNNSWMHNSLRLVRGKERCTLLIHPDDAADRGITDGQMVEVRSRVGCVRIPAQLDDGMMPGIVSIPHGWGHGRPGVSLRVAVKHAGASINDLTDEQAVDLLTGNAALSSVPVRVEVPDGG